MSSLTRIKTSRFCKFKAIETQSGSVVIVEVQSSGEQLPTAMGDGQPPPCNAVWTLYCAGVRANKQRKF